MRVPFYEPAPAQFSIKAVTELLQSGESLIGGGRFTERCVELISRDSCSKHALLTPSCTHALELAALLANIAPGDEVILPSWTFTSTANAFLLRGARIIFCDVYAHNLTINIEDLVSKIGPRTRVVCTVDYAGVNCDYEKIIELCRKYDLFLICDAAQSYLNTCYLKDMRDIGHLACLSFHGTKNVGCGEGGALLIDDDNLYYRAQVMRDKGTNRVDFLRGTINKYSWSSIGSSFILGELAAAFLFGQLSEARLITSQRIAAWRYYDRRFKEESSDCISFCSDGATPEGNGHIYFGICNSRELRDGLISHLGNCGISAQSHYEPLHLSPFGRYNGGGEFKLAVTEYVAPRLIRFPLWSGITQEQQDFVVEETLSFIKGPR